MRKGQSVSIEDNTWSATIELTKGDKSKTEEFVMEILATIDEYGTGKAIIDVIRYNYNGMPYIKVTRKVIRKDKLVTLFNLPEKSLKMVGSTILGRKKMFNSGAIGFVDEYGNGSVYIEISEYTHQERKYIKATRTIVNKNKTYTLFNLPDYAARDISAIVA